MDAPRHNNANRWRLTIFVFTALLFFIQNSFAQQPGHLNYVGSSTIGNFLEDADSVYAGTTFHLDTESESAGGELAILEGRADLAGVANVPSSKALQRGIVSSLIGWDAIAIITHESNPVKNLTLSQLKGIFTGKITNWKEVRGPGLTIQPYITSIESATHKVCRSVILGEEDYAQCETVAPDADILARVRANPGAIGHISFSFLENLENLRMLSVDGQQLTLTNSNYPITRPLYLLWWPGRREIAGFVDWVLSPEGQRLVMKRFIGAREGTVSVSEEMGTLVVYTETYPVEDGGTFYYPHRPYEIYTTDRQLVRRVPNQLSINDESPTKVQLAPGSYFIRPESARGVERDIFTVIESGKLTKVNVPRENSPATASEAPGAGASRDDIGRLSQEMQLPGKYRFLQPYGDMRIRAEQDVSATADRFRGRFRARGGAGAIISPAVKVDVRLVTSNNPDDPNSPYADFTDGFNQVRIAIDRGYLEFNPQGFSVFKLFLGKMPNPFVNSNVYSELTWDDDIQPEGGAFSFNFNQLGMVSNLSLTNGTFLMSQFSTGQDKSWLNASQVALTARVSERLELTLASGLYYFNEIKGSDLLKTVFDGNVGNATYFDVYVNGSDTILTERYASDFAIFDNFILVQIKGRKRPLTFKGQYLYNPGADRNNRGFAAGFSLGDLNETGHWRLYYQYQQMEQDAVFSPFVQDDFRRQTNFTGHVFGFAYAFDKKISLHAWDLIDEANGQAGIRQSRFRVDLNVKI
jgi:phosphate transport system substrate-binding protein